MKKILLFVNPKARSGDRCLEQVRTWLAARGIETINECKPMTKQEIQALIRKHAGDCDAVIVGGGDGSVTGALPALMEAETPLLLLPLGTANNLARTMGIPAVVEDALALLEKGHTKKIDIGLVNGIPFVNVVGLGLSTQVNRATRSDFKRWFGVLAFIATALKIALRMTPFKAKITCDDTIILSRSWQISVCNGRNYGSGLVIHEQANLRDGTLHGLSTELRKVWHFFGLIPALFRGRYRREQDVTEFEGARILIETRKPMHVDVDGDVLTKTPLDISVRPRALRMFVPPPVPSGTAPT